MKFEETKLAGAWTIDPVPIDDERGSFARTFCERELEEHGLEARFVQHSTSYSRLKGTLRGLHFQKGTDSEIKLVSCLAGAIFDVIVDMRPGSETYLNWRSFELSALNRRQLYVPQGFAHGFMTLSDDVTVNYLISRFHVPALARGVPFDDPMLGIAWPAKPTVMSERDRSWSYLSRLDA